jgi:DNA polymerase-3 subunit alpha
MKTQFVNLHLHCSHSILDSINRPEQVATRVKELNQSSVAVTEHGNINSSIEFAEACQKQDIKSIQGCEFNVCESVEIKDKENRYKHQVILAKNLAGWKKLVKLVSISNDVGFYYKPRIDWNVLKNVGSGDDLISFSGHCGSTLANIVSDGDNIKSDAVNLAVKFIEEMKAIFGPDNFFVEIQNLDNSEYVKKLVDCLRSIARITNTKCIATGDAHYAKPTDVEDHRLILCSNLKLTLGSAYQKLRAGTLGMDGFFKGSEYYIRSYDDLIYNTDEEKRNTVLIADMIEKYDILNKPLLPHFKCPNGLSEGEYLRELCREGWKKKNKNWPVDIYGNRVKHELSVIEKSKILESYFLIVDDFVRWANNNEIMTGVGRGSAGGSLVSYLLGITRINPIEYNLIFERFYNEGRNSPGHIALPDIDIDLPVYDRDRVVNYLRDKYGQEKVCQMSTYGTLQGKGAIKEVLRVTDSCTFKESNDICENIPDESKINDQMEESGEKTVLSWLLKYEPKALGKYCYLKDDGTLGGDYSEQFSQAIRLEGTIKSQGKHASGIVIAPVDLTEICPMVKPSTKADLISGYDMYSCEKAGLVKFDLLGVASYDKITLANNLIRKRFND